MKIKLTILMILVFLYSNMSCLAEELQKLELKSDDSLKQIDTLPKEEGYFYNFQKYSGFNFFVDKTAELVIKAAIKLKTKAKNVDVDLKIYSGWDLLRKKIKSLNIVSEKLNVKGIPINHFDVHTTGPILIKKVSIDQKKRNRVISPVNVYSRIEIDLDEVTRVINNLPEWKEVLGEINLPIPPFGYTQIALKDLIIDVNEGGTVQVSAYLISLVNPESEPVKLIFSGELKVVDKRLIVSNLKSEIQDIFLRGSKMEEAFSEVLEDLINPVFKFYKYEKKGLTIDKIDMIFSEGKVIFDSKLKLLPVNQT